MKYAILAKICIFAAIACQLASADSPDPKSEKAMQRQKEAKEKFRSLKKAGQVDRIIGNNTLRADKHGGKLAIQRKGQYLEMKLKEIVEKFPNGTEVSKIQ